VPKPGVHALDAPQHDLLAGVAPGEMDRFHDLGMWGADELTPRMGAVRGDSRVPAVRSAPLTAADVAPALREHYTDLCHPAVDLISSSLARFVDLSWRRRAALLFTVLTEPPLGCPQEEFDAYDGLM